MPHPTVTLPYFVPLKTFAYFVTISVIEGRETTKFPKPFSPGLDGIPSFMIK
jgi:hypothetical protein